MTFKVKVNGNTREVDVAEGTPILWVLRDELNLTGTKFGCGVASCGACTVHMDGEPVRACQTFVEDAEGTEITTIEGISAKENQDNVANAVQTAWQELDVVQCGYCQSGQIMSAIGLLKETPTPTDEEIDEYMSGNACRCATYQRIRAAIHLASEKMGA